MTEEVVQLVELVEKVPWADVEGAVSTLDEALRLARDATREPLAVWQAAGEQRFGDEFSVAPSQFHNLSDAWRLAYVARLVETIALMHGLRSEATPSPRSVLWRIDELLRGKALSETIPPDV
jgi:hypothetical protein